MARRRGYDSGDSTDDDFDGLPGGVGEDENYQRRYRVNETDFTKPREFANELKDDRAASRVRELQQEVQGLRGMAASRIQFWPDVGKFIIPPENTIAGHMQLVKGGEGPNLHFDASHYPYFDMVLAETANRPDLFDPSHPEYAKNEALRNNIAVIRNDVMGIYMDDGSFDPGDEKFVPKLVGVAKEIGRALANNRSFFGAITGPQLNEDLLNVEGAGAVHVYDMLMSRQRGNGFFADIVSDLYRMIGEPRRRWGLPPKEQTPFCEAGLCATPCRDVNCMSEAMLSEEMALQKEGAGTAWRKLARESKNPVQGASNGVAT